MKSILASWQVGYLSLDLKGKYFIQFWGVLTGFAFALYDPVGQASLRRNHWAVRHETGTPVGSIQDSDFQFSPGGTAPEACWLIRQTGTAWSSNQKQVSLKFSFIFKKPKQNLYSTLKHINAAFNQIFLPIRQVEFLLQKDVWCSSCGFADPRCIYPQMRSREAAGLGRR